MQCLNPTFIYVKQSDSDFYKRVIPAPCGKCIHCIKNKAIQWAFRIHGEAKAAAREGRMNLTICGTYNDENLPYEEYVNKDTGECRRVPVYKVEHLQKTIKKFRELLKNWCGERVKFKYFASFEYGGAKGRPHVHCIFIGLPAIHISIYKNWFRKHAGLMAKPLWQYGFCDVEETDVEDCKYVAKYVNKIDKRNWFKPPKTTQSKGVGQAILTDAFINWMNTNLPTSVKFGEAFISIPRYLRDKALTDAKKIEYYQKILNSPELNTTRLSQLLKVKKKCYDSYVHLMNACISDNEFLKQEYIFKAVQNGYPYIGSATYQNIEQELQTYVKRDRELQDDIMKNYVESHIAQNVTYSVDKRRRRLQKLNKK